jgi:hypothetical protein
MKDMPEISIVSFTTFGNVVLAILPRLLILVFPDNFYDPVPALLLVRLAWQGSRMSQKGESLRLPRGLGLSGPCTPNWENRHTKDYIFAFTQVSFIVF